MHDTWHYRDSRTRAATTCHVKSETGVGGRTDHHVWAELKPVLGSHPVAYRDEEHVNADRDNMPQDPKLRVAMWTCSGHYTV